jgi:hypothetical protein
VLFSGAGAFSTDLSTAHTHIGRRSVSWQHEPAGKTWPRSSPARTPDHRRRLGACRAVAALVSPGHLGPAGRAPSCLTRASHRPVVWPHEIPDSGISHRNTGSGPRSGTEAGDISPVFTAPEHAAGDFTTPGTNPPLECSSPSDTVIPHWPLFPGMRGTSPGRRLPLAPGDRRFSCFLLPESGR